MPWVRDPRGSARTLLHHVGMGTLAGILTWRLAAILAMPTGDGVDTGSTSRPAMERIQPVSPQGAPEVHFVHRKTGQTLTLRLFDQHGHMRPEALAELRALWVDTGSGTDHPVHWRLATLLVAVSAHWPGRPLHVVSGFRGRSRHTERSNHTRGRAVDFRVEGVSNRVLYATLRQSFAGVGVGYYPNSTFVHLDVRERDAYWIDYSGPGQIPCYSRSPAEDLAAGLVDELTYSQAVARGCRRGTSSPP